MQLALTNDQVSSLNALGVEKVEALLEAKKFGAYRAPFIRKWLEAKKSEKPVAVKKVIPLKGGKHEKV